MAEALIIHVSYEKSDTFKVTLGKYKRLDEKLVKSNVDYFIIEQDGIEEPGPILRVKMRTADEERNICSKPVWLWARIDLSHLKMEDECYGRSGYRMIIPTHLGGFTAIENIYDCAKSEITPLPQRFIENCASFWLNQLPPQSNPKVEFQNLLLYNDVSEPNRPNRFKWCIRLLYDRKNCDDLVISICKNVLILAIEAMMNHKEKLQNSITEIESLTSILKTRVVSLDNRIVEFLKSIESYYVRDVLLCEPKIETSNKFNLVIGARPVSGEIKRPDDDFLHISFDPVDDFETRISPDHLPQIKTFEKSRGSIRRAAIFGNGERNMHYVSASITPDCIDTTARFLPLFSDDVLYPSIIPSSLGGINSILNHYTAARNEINSILRIVIEACILQWMSHIPAENDPLVELQEIDTSEVIAIRLIFSYEGGVANDDSSIEIWKEVIEVMIGGILDNAVSEAIASFKGFVTMGADCKYIIEGLERIQKIVDKFPPRPVDSLALTPIERDRTTSFYDFIPVVGSVRSVMHGYEDLTDGNVMMGCVNLGFGAVSLAMDVVSLGSIGSAVHSLGTVLLKDGGVAIAQTAGLATAKAVGVQGAGEVIRTASKRTLKRAAQRAAQKLAARVAAEQAAKFAAQQAVKSAAQKAASATARTVVAHNVSRYSLEYLKDALFNRSQQNESQSPP